MLEFKTEQAKGSIRRQLEDCLADLPALKRAAVFDLLQELETSTTIYDDPHVSIIEGQKEILELIARDVSLKMVLAAISDFIQEQSNVTICSILLEGRGGLQLQHGIAPDLAESAGLRACWSKPIFSSSGTVLGLFAMYYQTQINPEPQDLELLEIASYLAGIAIQRNRSNQLLDRQKQVSELIARGAPLQEILDTLVNFIEEYSSDSIGSILFLNEDRLTVRCVSAPNLPLDYIRAVNGASIGEKSGSCGTAMYLKKPVIVEDIEHDPLWEDYKDFALEFSLRACWSMPILSRTGDVLGSFGVYYLEPRSPDPSDLKLLEVVTHLASIAIERHRYEEAVQFNEAKYRKISEMTSDYVFVRQIGKDGIKPIWSLGAVQSLTGYSEEEFRKVNWKHFTHPDEIKMHQSDLRKLLRGQSMITERRLITRDGDVRWMRFYSRPEWDEKIKKVTQIFTVAQDITEEKQAEEARIALERRLLEAQKLESLGVLAGGIAHDFNNLLVGILGNAELALLDVEAGSPVRETIEQIELAAHRAAELTRQMLAYSGRGRFVVQTVNLNALLEEMASLLRVSLSKNATLSYRLDPLAPLITADATQIRQVIMNLIVNASDAIGNKVGLINLVTKVIWLDRKTLSEKLHVFDLPEGPYVSLEVRDSGAGMPPETLSRIFEPFFSTKSTGRGLGLSAVQGIIRSHKGILKVESEPGVGTVFKIMLPCTTEQTVNPAEVAGNQKAVENRTMNGTILVIEDEAPVRSVIQRSLQKFGYDLIIAEDGLIGLELFKQNQAKIDCVLLDMLMPKMNGQQVYTELIKLAPSVKIILMSGYSEQEITVQFGSNSLKGFVQKPFSPLDLQRKVKEVIGE